mmetsp:Transcript_120942/g.338615  ORF Transcript_120942/g.338615 Transcript_120942/m.338615 type:complete len:249 (-) Transcript_120942:1139-1885(-)
MWGGGTSSSRARAAPRRLGRRKETSADAEGARDAAALPLGRVLAVPTRALPHEVQPVLEAQLVFAPKYFHHLLRDFFADILRPQLGDISTEKHLQDIFPGDEAGVVGVEGLEGSPQDMLLRVAALADTSRTELCVGDPARTVEIQPREHLVDLLATAEVRLVAECLLESHQDLFFLKAAVTIGIQPGEDPVEVVEASVVQLLCDGRHADGKKVRRMAEVLHVQQNLRDGLVVDLRAREGGGGVEPRVP